MRFAPCLLFVLAIIGCNADVPKTAATCTPPPGVTMTTFDNGHLLWTDDLAPGKAPLFYCDGTTPRAVWAEGILPGKNKDGTPSKWAMSVAADGTPYWVNERDLVASSTEPVILATGLTVRCIIAWEGGECGDPPADTGTDTGIDTGTDTATTK